MLSSLKIKLRALPYVNFNRDVHESLRPSSTLACTVVISCKVFKALLWHKRQHANVTRMCLLMGGTPGHFFLFSCLYVIPFLFVGFYFRHDEEAWSLLPCITSLENSEEGVCPLTWPAPRQLCRGRYECIPPPRLHHGQSYKDTMWTESFQGS